jgi:NAD(P)-dependent dehydrogenase (short-subunit alcohol dehydrogenase family)
MPCTADLELFRFDPAFGAGVAGKRILITGAGKDGGLGQAFALAAGLNGAKSVCVHFHRSYEDGFDLVNVLRAQGVEAFPLQADVTNMGDLWATRSYVIDQMGGLPPDVVICNSGLTERGYSFGRALKEVAGEPAAVRRARVRQHFIDNLEESRVVLDTKIDGFLAMTHLWAGESLHANRSLRIVYVSSRQAIDPGASVPGYAISNWAVLALPRVLSVNLGKSSNLVSAHSVLYPFVRTSMTDEYAENEKVFGRWQPRMLETHEATQAFLQLLARPPEETNHGMYELLVTTHDAIKEADAGKTDRGLDVRWARVRLDPVEESVSWSDADPLRYAL